jgi:Xaa-Pro aminopeptidase
LGNKTVYYSSNALDIFYQTGMHVWKEKLFSYKEKWVLLQKEDEIRSYLNNLEFDEFGIDFSKVTHKEFLEIQKLASGVPIIDSNPIAIKRMIKREDEIESLKKSARLNYDGFLHVYSLLVEGIEEKEVAFEFEKFVRERGASKLAFDPIIAFGDHTAFPHHKVTDRKLKKNDPISIDVGVILDGYASDMTRSFFLSPEKECKMEKVVLEASRKALEMCKPGVDFKEVQDAVDDFFKKENLFDFRKHSLGHGIGLEVHEAPFMTSEKRVLKEGMSITIEPGLYEIGKLGYRHEDTIIITTKGYENLYESRSWTR